MTARAPISWRDIDAELRDLLPSDVAEAIVDLTSDRTLYYRADPDVADVYGVFRRADDRCVAILYWHPDRSDFEADEDALDELVDDYYGTARL